MNWTVASKLLLSFVDTFYLFGSIATHSNKRNSMLNGNRMFDSCTIRTVRALMNSFYSIFFLPILFTFFAFILKYSILISYMFFFCLRLFHSEASRGSYSGNFSGNHIFGLSDSRSMLLVLRPFRSDLPSIRRTTLFVY